MGYTYHQKKRRTETPVFGSAWDETSAIARFEHDAAVMFETLLCHKGCGSYALHPLPAPSLGVVSQAVSYL